MLMRSAIILASLISLIPPIDGCFAGEEEPIIWISDGASWKSSRDFVLHPAANDTGNTYQLDISGMVTNTIRSDLTSLGFNVFDPRDAGQTSGPSIHVSIVFYQPGNIGGRWLSLGGGAAICIIRTKLFDRELEDQLADIIVADQIASGGLFSVGAEKTVLERTALKVARELARLLHVEPKTREAVK